MEPKITQRLDDVNVVIKYEYYTGEFIYDEVSNRFFKSLAEMKNHYMNSDFLPRYVYGTKLVPMRLDLDYILQNTYEDCTDDIESFIEDSLNGVEELRKAIDKFNKKNEHIKGYYVADFNVIVKLK